MSNQVGDFLLRRLREWGVSRIYGYPGDGINGIMGAVGRSKPPQRPEFVQVRHEEMAAFMACAHAKFTGEVGVCLATSGPGAFHLLNGLYDALLDHQPVVAIVGQQSRAALGGSYQQEVDLVSLFKDVAHEYVQMVVVPGQVRHCIDRAIRIARTSRSVTCLILPNDLQMQQAVEVPPRTHGTVHSGVGYLEPVVVPQDGGWRVVAAGPTTSVREEPYMATIIERFGVRLIIGKGGMGEATQAACVRAGCVYLQAVGGAAALLAQRIRRVDGVYFLDAFGATEAMWQLEVEAFETVVGIDTHGRDLFNEVRESSARVLKDRLGIG